MLDRDRGIRERWDEQRPSTPIPRSSYTWVNGGWPTLEFLISDDEPGRINALKPRGGAEHTEALKSQHTPYGEKMEVEGAAKQAPLTLIDSGESLEETGTRSC